MMPFQKSSSSLYLFNDEETGSTVSTLNSKYSNNENSYNGHHYIAISPDGTQIVTLNTENYQLKLCKVDNLNNFKKSQPIGYVLKNVPARSIKVNWSLSVSNKFTLSNEAAVVLIAVSCFEDSDMKYKNSSLDMTTTEKIGNHSHDDTIRASTWIITAAQRIRISSSMNNMGGVVKFLDTNKGDDSTEVVLIDAHGITKFIIKHEKIRNMINTRDENYNNGRFNPFSSDNSIEKFYFPTKFSMRRSLLDDDTCNFLIRQSLVKGRFFVEHYKNKVQTVEMYNLKTNLLENTFQKCEESATSVVGKGYPCFAISNNESLFAYCRGANRITIYLMENGLEVITKKFKERNIRILFLDFIQNDNKLLIVIEEEKYNEDAADDEDVTPTIVVWDLFSSSDNCVRKINDTSLFFPPKCEYPQRLANSSGNLITIKEDGTIISILKELEIIKLLNPENVNTRKTISLNIFDSSSTIISSATECHSVYDFSGNRLDSRSENSKGIIVKNPEPWIFNKFYKRISVYLDENKSIQLIIGESTVQVWRKRKSGLSSTRVLEYIWTNNFTERNRQMQLLFLEVGYKEFSLTLYIPSGNSPSSQPEDEITIEWPEKVNPPVDACRALEFLEKKRNEPSDPNKQYKFEELIQQTECIIKKFIVKKNGLWKMLDIHYDVMANLIRGNCVSIIKSMLFFKSDDGKNKYLHTPRCYSWGGKVKKTDLEIAIKCTEGSYCKDAVIIKYLLDYYSNNAIKTPNWMFTVAKAIPLLYEHQLEFYVKELFQTPCFGNNEVYLDQSNICNKDTIKNVHKNIHALNVNIGLVKRKECGFLRKLISKMKLTFSFRKNLFSEKKLNSNRCTKTIVRSSKVYVVPLPDFIVYPEGIDDKRKGFWKILLNLLKFLIWPRSHIINEEEKMSPFLRMLRKDNSAGIYDNPSIAAIIDFKWNAVRKFFLRRVIMYFIFALAFAVISDCITIVNADATTNFYLYIYLYLFVTLFLLYWLGFCLLNTERVQMKYNGWKRYLSFYNFFDLISVIMPLIVVSLRLGLEFYIMLNLDRPDILYGLLTIFNSFTILTISLEFILLSRYFEKAGTYIYIILNILKQIAPFLSFILVVVFGFGYAMFVLLTNHPSYKDDASKRGLVQFFKSVESVFFWTSGRWVQLDEWENFWPVDVYSIIGSILLVTILQNMLIAIMTGVYDEAKEVARHAALKYRAELISDYETIEKPFGNEKGNPRYIYFIGKSDYIEKWVEKSEKSRENHKNSFVTEIDNNNSWYYYRDDCYDESGNNSNENNEGGNSLHLYWFVDEDENSKKSKLLIGNVQKDNIQDEVKVLQDKYTEDDIKQIISLLQNRLFQKNP